MLKKLLSKIRDAVSEAIHGAPPKLSPEEQGKLENRFHYARPMGGFRLAPSGKHYRGWAPYHGKQGSKWGAMQS